MVATCVAFNASQGQWSGPSGTCARMPVHIGMKSFCGISITTKAILWIATMPNYNTRTPNCNLFVNVNTHNVNLHTM